MTPAQLTDYLSREIQPRHSTLPDVQRVGLEGARPQAMRIWLEAERLAAFGIAPEEVQQALARNNFLAAIGQAKGGSVQVDLLADTDLKSVEEFERLQSGARCREAPRRSPGDAMVCCRAAAFDGRLFQRRLQRCGDARASAAGWPSREMGRIRSWRRREVTYAYLTRTRSFPGARNCAAMLPLSVALNLSNIETPDFEREVRAALALWAERADIVFRYVEDAEAADIVIGAQDSARGFAFVNVFQEAGSGERIARITKATICLNLTERWEIGRDGDPATYNVRRVMAHEIGHALGLDHPGPDGGLMGYDSADELFLHISSLPGPNDRGRRLARPCDAAGGRGAAERRSGKGRRSPGRRHLTSPSAR